ncbi:MAG: S8 family serine peptidase, partial [Actinomycetota bacterium]|nr:S8 family serine peptidase [Actinomycetota bacterium]
MNGLLAHGPTRVLTGLLITAILSMAVVASPANAQSDAEDLYDDGSTLPLSAHGEALLGFLGPLPSGLASDDLAKALLATGNSTERNPFGLLVRFTESATAAEVAEVLGAVGGSLTGPSLDGVGLYLIETLRDLDAALEVLGRSPAVKWAGPDTVVSVADLPSDPRLDELWGLTGGNGIDAPGAWAHSLGDPSVVVAVIDTGVDLDHPDLEANIWTNPGEIADNGIDDDANGYIDDLHGWDFVNNDADPNDDHDHGTHVAGTIAGVANDVGVVGVAPGVRIMALKFLSASGGGYSSDAVSALSYAISNGASISNNSWGGGGSSGAMSGMLDQAAAADHLFVAAAGNNGSDNDASPTYPASYPQDIVLTVASTQIDGNRSSFSNYGELGVDVAAPGSAILSSVHGGGYATFSGTSMATPHVVGIVALVRSVAPELTAVQVKERLVDSSTWVDALSTVSGSGGRVDAAAAVGASVASAPVVSIVEPVASVTEGSPVTLTATAVGSDGTDLSASVSWTDSSGVVVATGGTFDWTPQVAGVQRLRAEVADAGLVGLDAVFVDVQEVQRSLTIVSPNGGEAFLPGDAVEIGWTSEGPVGSVDVSIERRAQVVSEFAGDDALPILDHQTLDIGLEVTDTGEVGTVELGIRLDHTYDADLQISLIHPDGTTVSLASGAGSWRNDFGEGAADCSGTLTVFADDADTAIDSGTAPFAGRFRPADALSAFTGKSGLGTWTLRIHDRWSWDQGEVYCADLSMGSEVAEVATGVDPTVGSATWVVPEGGVDGALVASVVAGGLSDRSDAWFTAIAPPTTTTTLPPCSTTTT